METQKNKYNHGKIYRVCDIGYTKFYYGRTVQSLSLRMGGHRKAYTKYKKDATTTYVSIYDLFDEFGVANCKIELVETYPCQSSQELREREGYYIQINTCVNKRVAGRSSRECTDAWVAEHMEQVIEYRKKYNAENKDKARERYENNREIRLCQCKEVQRKTQGTDCCTQ